MAEMGVFLSRKHSGRSDVVAWEGQAAGHTQDGVAVG